MAWTTPKDWRDGRDRLNAENLNRHLRDNLLALRAQAASIDGRVQHLEVGGFSAAMMRSVSLSNRPLLTDLIPPADSVFFYVAYLTGNGWNGGLFVDYDLWNSWPEYDATDSVPANNQFRSFDTGTGGANGGGYSAYVTKGTGGVLAFGGSSNVDQVCVRWYI